MGRASALQTFPFFGLSTRMQFAVKTALAMTLAFMIPMALGWPQPSTAAATVMIIAAAGDARDSLMKGTLRLVGTVLGAGIGLTLIACFPQDRLLYLLCTSLLVSLLYFLYRAYQGDGTIFMMAALVILMVFNGGQVENAFQYGIDRTHLTVFGVAVHTLVGSLLWPRRMATTLEEDARQLLALDRELLAILQTGGAGTGTRDLLNRIGEAESALAAHWQAAHHQKDDVAAYEREWHHYILAQRALTRELCASLEPPDRPPLDYAQRLPGYPEALVAIDARLTAAERAWEDGSHGPETRTPVLQAPPHGRESGSHLETARLIARVASVKALQDAAGRLQSLAQCISRRDPNLPLEAPATTRSAFVWLDPEAIKLGIRVFATFWLATLIWITLNPPGGFSFVVFSTALVQMVSFTPLQAKALYFLFSLGILMALPCYVLLLPKLSRSYELAAFIFAYAWLGHYLLKGPITLFFMLGLLTLGLDNTMNYSMEGFLTTILLFYLVITLLVFVSYAVFNPRPEHLFLLMRRRFFRHAAGLLEARSQPPGFWHAARGRYHRCHLELSLGKLRMWASKIDPGHFRGSSTEDLTAFVESCELVAFRIRALADTRRPDPALGLTAALRADSSRDALQSLARGEIPGLLHGGASASAEVERRVDQLFDELGPNPPGDEDIALFYNQLNQLALLWRALGDCEQRLASIDWGELAQPRF